jgi:hypothetical protein
LHGTSLTDIYFFQLRSIATPAGLMVNVSGMDESSAGGGQAARNPWGGCPPRASAGSLVRPDSLRAAWSQWACTGDAEGDRASCAAVLLAALGVLLIAEVDLPPDLAGAAGGRGAFGGPCLVGAAPTADDSFVMRAGRVPVRPRRAAADHYSAVTFLLGAGHAT